MPNSVDAKELFLGVGTPGDRGAGEQAGHNDKNTIKNGHRILLTKNSKP